MPRKRRQASSSRRLGELEQIILFALLRLGDSAYGASVAGEILERTGQAVSPGAVYTTLERLEARGYVSSRFGEPTPERGGKRKKHYRLEAAGAEALSRSWSALRRMADEQAVRLRQLAGREAHGD